ncbi:MAG: repair protein RecN [Acidobacteria bacterium]|nr:repair protein RecN [Acidobacteriota bacterium]
MLRYLRIRDFALIRNLGIDFGEGLTVLTGETGSGKSIIVDAFGLLIGGRSSQEMVRANCDVAILEGVFSVENPRIREQLGAAGMDVGEDSLVIRREITAGGRSRVFINNNLATLALLKAIGGTLSDIHGQQDHQALLDLSSHLEWLDRFGGNEAAVGGLRADYSRLKDTARKLDALAMDEQERCRLLDILRFQVEEIRRAGLRPGEKELLDNERSLLSNREKVFAWAHEAYGLLYEGEKSILGQTGRLARVLEQLSGFDPGLAVHLDALREGLYRMEDLSFVLRDYAGGMDFSPERLDQVERRLAELERLTAKYGKSTEEVLAFADEAGCRLEELTMSDESSAKLAAELEAGLKQYLDRAERLSSKRRKDAARLEREIGREFQALAMEKTELSVRFHPKDRPGGAQAQGRIPGYCGPEGVDQVELLLAPNVGEEMRPLARIASGGELSRIMLAIKTLCGGDEAGKTLVFDEIDAGIGGRVAEVVGKKLRQAAAGSQVLCVTHLPQIAAFAREHFRVTKETVDGRTETFAGRLDEAARVEELARMMGGEVITETTRRHAREMFLHAAGRGNRKESRA